MSQRPIADLFRQVARWDAGEPEVAWSVEERTLTVGGTPRGRFTVRRAGEIVAEAEHFLLSFAAQDALEQLWRWSVASTRARAG